MEITKKEISDIIIRYVNKGYGWEELYWGDDLYNYTEEMKEVVSEMYDECISIGTEKFKEKYK